ncbi:MAG: DUF4142 domain-containing protein [Croceibacterium sp.]
MRAGFWATTAAAALALGGCATISGLGQTAAATSEHARYMGLAAASELFEIEAAQVALTRARRPDVRAFAEMLLRDHTRSAQALASAAQRGGFVAPAGILDAGQRQMLNQLQNAGPETADALYLRQQEAAHGAAYDLHRAYALNGDSTELREFAAMAAPIVREHLAAAQRLD